MEKKGKGGGGHEEEKLLKVKVFAPRSPQPKKFEWDRHLTVAAAAAQAAAAFEYAPGKPTLAKDGVTLDPEDELQAAGVKNGDNLELVDIGGGV